MKKSILFNTKMVEAILDSKKTTKRKIIKRKPSNDESCGYGFWKEYNKCDDTWYIKDYNHSCVWWPLKEYIEKFSTYHIGDIVYVKETWMMQSMSNYDKKAKIMFRAKPNEKLKELILSNNRYEDLLKYSCKNGWQPSIFMPKEATRILLKIVDVRIERLQDMELDDLLKEGMELKFPNVMDRFTKDIIIGQFIELWDNAINKKDFNKYRFRSNPWVWVIDFEEVKS